MPAAIKLQREYGDAIQVILVESQNSGFQQSVGFAMARKWLGSNAIWTSGHLFSTGSNGLPNFALLSPTGEIVLMGSSNQMHSQVVDAIEEMVKNGSNAPEGAPSAVAKGYADFGAGKWAKGQAALIKARDKAKTDGDRASAVDGLNALESALSSSVTRVSWLAENGYPMRAQDLAKSLQKGVKGQPALEEQVATLAEVLSSEQFQAEVAAAKALTKLEAKLYEDVKNEKLVEKLSDVVDDHLGTKVAKRASELAQFAGYAVPKRSR